MSDAFLIVAFLLGYLLGSIPFGVVLTKLGGTLRNGAPADVTVIDPDIPWILNAEDLKSKCKNTPFDDSRFSGRVVRTIVGGRTVYEHV